MFAATPLGLWLTSAFLLAPSTAGRDTPESTMDAVLTKESTTAVARLLGPTKPGQTLLDQWRLEDISVGPRSAVFVIRGPGETAHRITVLPPQDVCPIAEQGSKAPTCITTRHFLLVLPSGLPKSLKQLLIARIQANDQVNPWHHPGPNDKQRTRSTISGTWPTLPVSRTCLPAPGRILQLLIVLWFLITILTIPAFQRALRLDVPSRAAAVAIFALAIWLRLSRTMPLPVGPNGHPNVTILELFRSQPHGFLFYGNTFWAFFHLVGGFLEHFGLTAGPWQDALPKLVFVTNALLGASIPMAALALARLSGMSRTTSLAAALLLACLPIHLRLSASESRFVLASFFLSVALVQSMAAWRLRSWALAVAAVASWTLATQARPEIALALSTLPFALSAASCRFDRRAGLWLAAGLAVLLLLSLDGQWLLSVAARAWAGQGAANQLSLSCLFRTTSWTGPNPSIIWTDPRFIPRWIPALALAGLWGTWWRQGTRHVVFWILLSATTLATGACFAQDLNTARLQAHSLPWLAILAARGIQELASLCLRILGSVPSRLGSGRSGSAQENQPSPGTGPAPRWPGRCPLTTLVFGFLHIHPAIPFWALSVLAVSSAWHHGLVLLGPTCITQKEYLFVTHQVARLPGRCTILLPGRQGIYNTYQPYYAKDRAQGRPTWIATNDPHRALALVSKLMASPNRSCLLFYRPSVCQALQPVRALTRRCHIPAPSANPEDGPVGFHPPFQTHHPRDCRHCLRAANDAAHLMIPVPKCRSNPSSAGGWDHPESPNATSSCPGCILERQLRRYWRLVPLAVTKLKARPCWAERYDGDIIPVGFYRIVSARHTDAPARPEPAGFTKPAVRVGPPNAGSL